MAAVLMASVGLNVFLWRELQHQRVDTRAWEARVAEVQASLTEMEASRIQSTNHSTLDVREQARMRNEVGQLRAQVADAEAKKEEALREAAKLQSQVANAVQKMEGLKKKRMEKLLQEESVLYPCLDGLGTELEAGLNGLFRDHDSLQTRLQFIF